MNLWMNQITWQSNVAVHERVNPYSGNKSPLALNIGVGRSARLMRKTCRLWVLGGTGVKRTPFYIILAVLRAEPPAAISFLKQNFGFNYGIWRPLYLNSAKYWGWGQDHISAPVSKYLGEGALSLDPPVIPTPMPKTKVMKSETTY